MLYMPRIMALLLLSLGSANGLVVASDGLLRRNGAVGSRSGAVAMAVRRSMGRRAQESCSQRATGFFYSAAQPTPGAKVNARKVRRSFTPVRLSFHRSPTRAL